LGAWLIGYLVALCLVTVAWLLAFLAAWLLGSVAWLAAWLFVVAWTRNNGDDATRLRKLSDLIKISQGKWQTLIQKIVEILFSRWLKNPDLNTHTHTHINTHTHTAIMDS
jgi:hypothetical protein